jgi:hypothetical protein
MQQDDLFGPAEPQQPVYLPDPDRVRRRLERIVGEARAASILPWEASKLSLYRIIVPDMTRYLPDDEAERWRAEFEAEVARLEAA